VRVFEPHVPAQAVADSKGETPAGPKLPPNVFSNLPTAPTVDSWIIILFDVLNTPTSDQAYARKQLTEMLKTLPKGHPVALYLLTNRLTMIQGFTDDPEKMMAAAESLSPSRSHVLTTEAQRQQQEGRITATTSELMANAPSGTLTDNELITQTNAAKVQQLRDLESFQLADRAKFTMAALEGLSRAVSGYPGRKNLIWLSAGFPARPARTRSRYHRQCRRIRTMDCSAEFPRVWQSHWPADRHLCLRTQDHDGSRRDHRRTSLHGDKRREAGHAAQYR